MSSFVAGFLVHCLTASGAALGLAALFAAADGRFAMMFAWLGVAFVIDAVDGTLARRFKVKETVPAHRRRGARSCRRFLRPMSWCRSSLCGAPACWRRRSRPPSVAWSARRRRFILPTSG